MDKNINVNKKKHNEITKTNNETTKINNDKTKTTNSIICDCYKPTFGKSKKKSCIDCMYRELQYLVP